jgi:hypothetical protein
LRRTRAVITPQVSASKRRFFAKKRAKNFIRLATSGRRRGQSLQPQSAKRRHDVFLLLFVHKKKTFLASLRWASTRSAIRAFLFQVLKATSVSIARTSENNTAK